MTTPLNLNWPAPRPERPTTPNSNSDYEYPLDIRDAQEEQQQQDEDPWGPYFETKAPKGAPNILYIVFDDTGFGTWNMFGGKVQMPNLERISNKGLIYTSFHTTALCSPTRSSLLNGRNANSNGMACVEETTSAFPGSNGRIPKENALIAETLSERGYNTYCIGKWHLCPREETSMASTKENWPLGRGFERFYGFLGGETDQWYPDLIYDNHQIEPPYAPDMSDPVNGYHLSKDLVDKAISFIHDGKTIAPDKPWMMHFCPGANHAPHQIWPALIGNPGYENPDLNDRCTYNSSNFIEEEEGSGYGTYSDKTKSVFAEGYEKYRIDVTARMTTPLGAPVEGQKNVQGLGIFPPGTLPTPINPHGEGTNPDDPSDGVDESILRGRAWPETDYVIPWDGYPEDQEVEARQELFIRMAETFAAFSTYTDRQIGRLLKYLDETGQMENTIIIALGDNGASGEGGPNGSINENLFFNGIPDNLNTNVNAMANLGTEKTYNHYPSGWAWAFDTPFKYWKRWSSYEGGDATPFMICGPGIDRQDGDSGFRKQYIHACDLVPTLYEHLNLEAPAMVKGYPQNEIDGKSFAYTFDIKFDEPNYPTGDPDYQFPYKLAAKGSPDAPGPDQLKETQFYAMLGTRGIWHKGWHACTVHAPAPSGWSNFDQDTWELYCMDGAVLSGDIFGNNKVNCSSGTELDVDPLQSNSLDYGQGGVEGNDLSQILDYLKDKWDQEAFKYFGKPLDDRDTYEFAQEERPSLTPQPDPKARWTYTYLYYPGCSEIPEAEAPNIRGRSYEIRATVDFTKVTSQDQVQGVLFSHGGRFGGHSLYINDDHFLCYTYNWLGQQEQKLMAITHDWSNTLGKISTLGMKFIKEDSLNQDPIYGSSAVGEVQIWINEQEVGRNLFSGLFSDFNGNFLTQPGKFSLCGEGMNIGRDAGQPVSSDYDHQTPYEFEGATLQKVEVWVDLNDEVANAFEQSKAMHGMLWRD
ncbi:MAG: sulfatase-like hydrolase/transferase [Cyanobacteria bacterium P01_F01_bin.150]